MKLFLLLALLGMASLSLALTTLNATEALLSARIITSPDHPALTPVFKRDGGFYYVGTADDGTIITTTVNSTPSSTIPMSTVTAYHKDMTTAFWTLYESGWKSAMLITTQSTSETTSVFTTSFFNDTVPTTTAPASYAAVPTSMTSNGMQIIFTVTAVHEGTFAVHAPGFGMYWATTSSEVNTQTDWPWPPTKSMTVVDSTTLTTTTASPTAMPTTSFTTTTVAPTGA